MPVCLPQVILVRPQLAENIGMTARAMMNCGLADLRLVAPLQDHLSEKAIAASSGAEEILQTARTYPDLASAVADLQIVLATTARRRNQVKTIYNAEKAVQIINQNIKTGSACGIMFGPERTGLENDEVSLADAIIEIPLNPKHCSLNLSQAVLLVGYEWYKTQIDKPDTEFVTNAGHLATRQQLFKFFEHLEQELSGYKKLQDEEKKPALLRNLHNIFTRNQLTEQEINTLYGLIAALKK